MRVVLIPIIAVAAVVALAATAAATPAGTTGGAPPCVPKVTKLKGKPEVFECGPATGTLRVGGKNHVYTHGFCQQSKSAGLTLELDLGTLAPTIKGNAGQPYLSIVGAKAGAIVNGYFGGKLIANGPATLTGHFPDQGTFKSKYSGAGFGASFSGTWNCHGVVWQAP